MTMILRNAGRSTQALVAAVLLPILLGGCPESGILSADRPAPEVVTPATHRDLKAFFSSLDYDLDTVEAGVPPFVLATLPADLSRTQVHERKRLFFLSLLPMVLLVNEEVRADRERFLSILNDRERGARLSERDQALVASLAEEYRVEGDPLADAATREDLLARLDVIPPSLALAQAAVESGYGTSRFALLANNLFGELTDSRTGGLLPLGSRAGEGVQAARRFSSVYASVKSYVRNLNTHRAYTTFRLERARLRAEGKPLQGLVLVNNLTAYSIRGKDYVHDVRRVMTRNRLTLFAGANLRQTEPETILEKVALFRTGRPLTFLD